MTLRLRLVLALVLLVTAGLATFGIGTYVRYRGSEFERLDAQIRSSASLVATQLDQAAGLGDQSAGHFQPGAGGRPGGPGGGPPDHDSPPVVVPTSTWAELLAADGTVLSSIELSASSAAPELPTSLPAPTPGGRLFTVGSTSGSGSFRVLVTNAGQPDGRIVLVAVPTTEVTKALHGLVLDETAGAALLLVALTAGAWLVLRRGLRPLERMAATARTISAGDLSQRVRPSGGATEVGQLGLALNTMLDDIEGAFAERDATEVRLRQFLADASHELRTPLTSIQGFAELFRLSGDQARVDLPTILRRIEEESARMKVLVEELLLLARLDQRRPPERGEVDLTVLGADACADAVATAPDRSVTLDAPVPVIVSGDEAHLRQAVANLLTNALRHTPSGTPIEVGVRLDEGAAVVSVRDHGSGLSPEALTHAFDRFWQADTARVGAGAGLGLAIVASVAAEHGGTAAVANTPGGGALFSIRLPLCLAPGHRGPSARLPTHPPKRERASVAAGGKPIT
jgi:two-component system OmpR family sensor kinase